eukprot:TRINITY_DN51581_c0_g1_i1.p1 TRINITY_DN51581_c0_g1~~TRINITY_DN51581_c0_g1_i1.p1  ORF type:complete len:297 (+),score=95.56 TRINITY_DN51581_c0_g1_i1:83-892(+)
MYVIDVATDLFGTKHNTRLEFAGPPTWQELVSTAEAHFDRKQRMLRPPHAPDLPFRVQTMQTYDSAQMRWVDLDPAGCLSLQNGAQVHLFQPQTGLHSDAPGAIPPASESVETWLGSPARARIAADAGLGDAFSERLRSVFSTLDQDRARHVNLSVMRDQFSRYELPWTHSMLGDYYGMTGFLSYEDWVRFAARYPHLIDSLYYRMHGYWLDRAYYEAARSAAAEAAAGSPSRRVSSPRQAVEIKTTAGTDKRKGITSAHPFKLSGKYS